MKYTVHFVMEVSTAVEVEAEDAEAAVELAYESPKMPGSMSHNAFGRASVGESEWRSVAVSDESGEEVSVYEATP